MKDKFYDGNKLMTMLDLDGNKPELYLCTTNRSAGKTTYFSRYLVRRFLRCSEKFGLLYRYGYELDDVASKFFDEIRPLFFNDYTMSSKKSSHNGYATLTLYRGDDEVGVCGYAIALNASDKIRKCSHLLSDVTRLFFDEFQAESGEYLASEVDRLLSVHTSLARGGGSQSRYLPIIMTGNPVSTVNPYYTALGISSRLSSRTHFMRGHGWVMEQGFNESASNAIKMSGIYRALSANNSNYVNYATNGSYLSDDASFVGAMDGAGKYVCTLIYGGHEYGVFEYASDGILYVTDKSDVSYPLRISVALSDHAENTVLMTRYSITITRYRELFSLGHVRFKNQLCKSAFIALIGMI